jgi:ABC-type Fe3+/spermidine/putrescine transport system ATPase subunit
LKAKEQLIKEQDRLAPESTASQNATSVVGVSKRFGKTSVLENISFEVAEGEALVLLGASGSGKTTILRIIAGLEQPYTGKVILHGRDVTELPARERGVGVIFQSYALFPKMTVEKNIGYGLRIRKRKRKEIKKTVNELLELVQLQEHRKKYPSQLSGGQQQRVAIARRLLTSRKSFCLTSRLARSTRRPGFICDARLGHCYVR